MRTLYLLGAGASAAESNITYHKENRLKYIPTVASFPYAIEFLLSRQTYEIDGQRKNLYMLKDLNPELSSYLENLLKGTKKFGTPDTYAKSLLLKYGPKSKEYRFTKLAISFVIQAIQIVTGVDPRYYQFFSALLNFKSPSEGNLHEDVFIATWNYDLQLNESLTSLLGVGPKEIVKSGINFHGNKPENNSESFLGNSKRIFRINGYAGSVIVGENGDRHQDFSEDLSSFYNSAESIEIRMKNLVVNYNSENVAKDEFFINFAWDKNEASKQEIAGLEELAKKIECLVVILFQSTIER